MSASTPVRRVSRDSWPLLLVAGVAAVYAFGQLFWFLNTPLGKVPVLDAREGLAFANAIVSGHLPPEPFYRAPGYALVLAGLRLGGIAPGALFGSALLLGALLHVVNATLVARIARTWFDHRTAACAGLIAALDPVLVHFSLQAGDTVPAITCLLAGITFLAPEFRADPGPIRRGRWAAASLAWAAATILRPNYLLTWAILPVLGFIRLRRKATAGHDHPLPEKATLAGAVLSGALLFVAIAVWQHQLCGRFGFMPTQGAYNLWAANEPGSKGRYFIQRYSFSADVAEGNPTRAESMVRYQRETGQHPADLAVVNSYWKRRFVEYVGHHPVEWVAVLGRKLYAFLNDWPQYNNETPAFHLQRSPWLRWNPIGWGALLVLAVAGSWRFAREARAAIAPIVVVAITIAAACLLFFVSARFRLPLEVLLALPAGAVLAAPHVIFGGTARHRIGVAALCVGAALLTYSNFDDVRDKSTYVQDHALLARAAATVGDDALAWREANAALTLRGDHPDATRIAIAAYFNLLLDDDAPPADEPQWRAICRGFLARTDDGPDDLRAVAAVALWRAGERDASLSEWRRLGAAPSAVAARQLAGDAVPTPSPTNRNDSGEPLVRLAGDPHLSRIAQRVFNVTPPHD